MTGKLAALFLTKLTGVPHFLRLADRQKPWLPAAIAGMSWRALGNIREQRKIMRLMKAPPFVDVVQNNPKFAWKYLTQQYLVKDLAVSERSACFLHHYDRLYRTLPDGFLRQILHWSAELHQFRQGNHLFTVSMGLSRECDKEGELSLVLQVDGENIYTMSFTVVPGWVVKSPCREVLLISRSQTAQATKGHSSKTIRGIRRAIDGLNFGSLLLAGLKGVAGALQIPEVVCLCSNRNIAYSEVHAVRFRVAYEGLFEKEGVSPSEIGFLVMPVSLNGVRPGVSSGSHDPGTSCQQFIKESTRSACANRLMSMVGNPIPPTTPEGTCKRAEELILGREESLSSVG